METLIHSLIIVLVVLVTFTLLLAVVNVFKSKRRSDDERGWLIENWWVIPLVIVGVVLLYYSVPFAISLSWKSPSPKAVWEITKNYWLWIVLILGIPFFFLYAVEKPWAKALQWCLAAIVAMLFVATPFVDWAWGEKRPPEKMVLSMVPGGKSRHIPVPQGKYVVMDGEDFRYHCVYGDGHEESFGEGEPRCSDGHVPFVYASNNREKESNTVVYSYAQRK